MHLTASERKRLADAFIKGQDQTHTPEVQAMIRRAVNVIHRDFDKIPVEVRWTNRDPYKSYDEMRSQVRSTGVLYIWTGASDVPMWDELTNWKARAVHDWDHISNQFDFTMDGEFEGFRSAARKNPQLAPLYLSEIAMQAAVANTYGDFAAQQKIVLASDPSLKSWVKGLSGLGGPHAFPVRGHRLVSDTAVVVTTAGAEQAMLSLAARGFTFLDASAVLEAALAYNAMIQGAMRY